MTASTFAFRLSSRFLAPAATGILLGFASQAPVHAVSTISQSQSYSGVGSSPATLTWQKFNTNLGTLTGIILQATGGLTGSFSVTNNTSSAVSVKNSESRLILSFIGSGAPDTLQGGRLEPIATSPVSNITGSTVAANATQVYTLSGPNNLPSIFSNEIANLAYYSASGGGTFDLTAERSFAVQVTGANFSVDNSLTLASGTINLTYEYEPTEIPLPLPVLGAAAGFGFLRQQRRRIKLAREQR